MASLSAGFAAFVVGTVVTLVVPVLAVWLVFKLFQGLFALLGGLGRGVAGIVGHAVRFVRAMAVDALHLGGGLVTGGVLLPLSLANVLIGRLSAARHYGRAFEDEFVSSLVSLYRLALGHPVRFLGLGALTHGLERKLPDLVARAPRTGAVPARRPARPGFPGYDVVRELPAGGSGARLYLARPNAEKARELAQRGHGAPSEVVIKSFDQSFGSTLPQIVRESRALEAAKRLGHVLEHELSGDRFHYVMPFVPGDDLDVVTRRLHAAAGDAGLDRRALQKVVGYASDLCTTLERFHGEGLWHKDIKPANLLVSGDRLQVVDLGLVTPLSSALTLTTHGTEYFRDPELVRLALRGVKVHEVDGVKFDVYSAGAVLFSMLENSFPAHGSLSRLTRPVPDALAWIVRRAMGEIQQRYPSARMMGRDLAVVLAAADPFQVRPAELPSFQAHAEPERALRAAQPHDSRAAEAQAAAVGSVSPPTASTVRRRTRRGVLASLALVAMVTCIVGGGLAVVQELRLRTVHAEALAQREHAAALRAAADAAAEVQLEWHSPEAARGVGRVLVHVDPRVSRSSAIGSFVAHVRRGGFEPIGLGTGAEEVDLAARIGRVVGAAELGDAATVTRLERWLAGAGADLSAVLWLGPGSRDGAVASVLVTRTQSTVAAASPDGDCDR